jgi:hypothetical protein
VFLLYATTTPAMRDRIGILFSWRRICATDGENPHSSADLAA